MLAAPLAQHPSAFAHLLQGVDLLTGGAREVVVAGERPDLLEVVHRRWLPDAVLAWGERFDSPLWEGRADGRAYVCEGFACKAPASSVADLESQLAA